MQDWRFAYRRETWLFGMDFAGAVGEGLGVKRAGFVCEFGGRAGWGHLMRCVSLAQAFRERGWETLLASPSAAGAGLPAEAEAAFDARTGLVLDPPGQAPEALARCAVAHVDDMYRGDDWFASLRRRLEQARGGAGPLLSASDDLGRRSLAAADVAINSELGLDRATAPAYAARRELLLGERHALVRPGFGRPKPVEEERPEGALPVFVMIGGTDAKKLTAPVLRALAATGDRRLMPVVAGGERREGEGAEDVTAALREGFAHWRRLPPLDSAGLAGWMDFSEAAVIGCGSSVYELACRRRPFLGICLADNQAALARRIERRWGLPVADVQSGFDEGAFGDAWRRLMAAVEERGAGAPEGVDAGGAGRVADALARLAAG